MRKNPDFEGGLQTLKKRLETEFKEHSREEIRLKKQKSKLWKQIKTISAAFSQYSSGFQMSLILI